MTLRELPKEALQEHRVLASRLRLDSRTDIHRARTTRLDGAQHVLRPDAPRDKDRLGSLDSAHNTPVPRLARTAEERLVRRVEKVSPCGLEAIEQIARRVGSDTERLEGPVGPELGQAAVASCDK